MPKIQKKTTRAKWTPFLPERRWQDGSDISTLNAGKYNKHEGISLKRKGIDRQGKEYQKSGKYWISSNTNANSWINWLYLNIKDIFRNLWQKEIEIGNSQKIGKKIEELNKELGNKEVEISRLVAELAEYNLVKEELEKKKELASKMQNSPESYEKILKDFKENYVERSYKNNTRNEDKIKGFIENNRWLLGLDCEFCKKNVNIDQQTQLDLHIINNFGHNKIFEFKSPNLPPFISDTTYKRLKATKDLLEALDEIICYMKRTNLNAQISAQGGLKILEPSGFIVIGYSLNQEQTNLLEAWNMILYPHIRIITYNHLLDKAKNELSLIKEVLKNVKK